MTVELLRRTSGLIRDRVAAATPGPWWPYDGAEPWSGDEKLTRELDALDTRDVDQDARWLVWDKSNTGSLFHGDVVHKPDGIHICSWHPGVALAVAGAIDAFLATHWPKSWDRWHPDHVEDEHPDDGTACTDTCIERGQLCNGCGTRECKELDYWTPIAHAYLGEPA